MALGAGAVYAGIGVTGWLQADRGTGAVLSSGALLLALWSAIGIVWIGFVRPDGFHVTSPEIGPWLALSLAAPLALVSLRDLPWPSALPLVALWPLSVVPLGVALSGSETRSLGTLVAGALTVLAMASGYADYVDGGASTTLAIVQVAAITGIALGPALLAAHRRPAADPTQPGQVLIGLAPIVGAIVLAVPPAPLIVFAAGSATIALRHRATLRQLTRTATRAVTQRDLAVAAVEGERRRLAAQIHDGPLQSLLLLGQQLETQEQRDLAATARAIAIELRDVAGDLRLPLLDDLGLGPALDWLAERAERMSGVSVTVASEGLQRPPPEVELAAFRIAQEAVSNAIRHGEPPIVITYRTTGEHLILSVDDAGIGIRRSASRHSGGHGLLNMAQRAEQIGARFELVPRADRGTHVGVEWPANA
ncbi:MAG: hypothetical protein H0U86_02510 [Chloroflexi bacterium]|nr:hypothetical protein [Chloroflexota bacterium]